MYLFIFKTKIIAFYLLYLHTYRYNYIRFSFNIENNIDKKKNMTTKHAVAKKFKKN